MLFSIETCERSHRDLELLRLFAREKKETKAGKGHDLEAVLAQADDLLEEMEIQC